jgi:translation initiation factor 5
MELNINRENNDPFYRYKMEKISITFEGKGKQTKLNNLINISKNINIPVSIILKYLGKSFSIQSNESSLSLNGHLKESNIQEKIYEMIDFFVLCKKCNIPEISYELDKKNIKCSCSACGSNYNLESNKKLESKVIEFMKIYIAKNGSIINNNVKKVCENNNTNQFISPF